MRNNNILKSAIFFAITLFFAVSMIGVRSAAAASAKEIDGSVDEVLKSFSKVVGSGDVLKSAKGVLVFPVVYKGGIGLGGEYGEGALRIKGKTVDYYNTFAASIGFQLGGQKKTIILAFMDKDALTAFRASSGWKVGLDASVAVIAIGAGGSIDSACLNRPIVAFVLDQKGLMYNITLEGAKITRMKR